MGALPDNEIVPPAISIEDRLRLIINTILCLILRATAGGAFDFINQQWLEFTGLKMENVKGQGWHSALHSEDVEKALSIWHAGLAARKPFEHEARVRRFDGEYRWFLIRNVPLRDFRSRIVQWYGTGHNIDVAVGKRLCSRAGVVSITSRSRSSAPLSSSLDCVNHAAERVLSL